MNTLFDALFAPLSRRNDPLLLLADESALTGQAFLALVLRQAQALQAAGVGAGAGHLWRGLGSWRGVPAAEHGLYTG